jgi:hypothetical protein
MEVIYEISAPIPVDEAWKLWLKIRYRREAPKKTSDDAAYKEFVSGLRARKGLLFFVDCNGERQDVGPDEWKNDNFIARQLATKGRKPSGRPILCISQKEIELWARQELRGWLLGELQCERLAIEKARDIWAESGTGDLEGNPDPASFDPMQEVYWTLPMAVAWITWRNPQRVVGHWDKYRSQLSNFHFEVWKSGSEERKGWILRSDEYDSDNPVSLWVNNEDWLLAKQKLWAALQRGELKATGLNQSGDRLFIDAVQWQDHAATPRDWKKVTVAVKDVLLVCGSSQGPEVQPAGSSPIQKSLKKKLLGSDVMKDWVKNHMLTNKDNPTSKKDEMELLAAAYPEYRPPTRAPYTLARHAAATELNMRYWLKRGPKGAKPPRKNADSTNSTEIIRTNYAAKLRDDIRISKKIGA